MDFWGYMLKYRKTWASEFRIFLLKAKLPVHTQADVHTHNLYQELKQQKSEKSFQLRQIPWPKNWEMVGSPGHQKSERCGCWYLGLASRCGCKISSSDKTGIALKNFNSFKNFFFQEGACSCTSTVALEIQILFLPQPCDLYIFGPIHPWFKKI